MTRGVTMRQVRSNEEHHSTASRREREKARRRDDILRAAKEVFFTRGFHTATVDDVAQAAEVSKGTVYLYFDTKETILAHLLLDGLDALVADLETAFAADQPLDAHTRLRRLASAYLKFFQTYPEYYRLIMAFDRGTFQASVAPETYQAVYMRSLRGLEWLVRAVEQACAEGLITCTNARHTASVVWAGVNGVLVLLSHPLRAEVLGIDLEELYNSMIEVLIAGLKKE
jgi:TetR/AcrR family transcriptional regulator